MEGASRASNNQSVPQTDFQKAAKGAEELKKIFKGHRFSSAEGVKSSRAETIGALAPMLIAGTAFYAGRAAGKAMKNVYTKMKTPEGRAKLKTQIKQKADMQKMLMHTRSERVKYVSTRARHSLAKQLAPKGTEDSIQQKSDNYKERRLPAIKTKEAMIKSSYLLDKFGSEKKNSREIGFASNKRIQTEMEKQKRKLEEFAGNFKDEDLEAITGQIEELEDAISFLDGISSGAKEPEEGI